MSEEQTAAKGKRPRNEEREKTPRRSARGTPLHDASDLPISIRRVIDRLVRRTRLWRRERAEVTAELIAHFRDGLDAGRSADDLIKAFGDPDRAATLIRRAKRRNRPIWWRSIRRVGQFAGIGTLSLLVLYVAYAFVYYSHDAHVTRDYVAEMNRPILAAPESDRAWPLYRAAMTTLAEGMTQMEFRDQTGLRPGDERWQAARDRLVRHRDVIELIRRASHRPVAGLVIGTPTDEADIEYFGTAYEQPVVHLGLISAALPQYSTLRIVADVLAMDCYRAMEEGEPATVGSNIRAMIRIAEHAREQPLLIGDLIFFAILALAMNALGDVLAEAPELLCDDELRDLSHELSAHAGGGRFMIRFEGERWVFEDVLQRIYTDDGRGSGRLAPESHRYFYALDVGGRVVDNYDDQFSGVRGFIIRAAQPAAAIVVADRAQMQSKYEQLLDLVIADARKPLWEQRTFRLDEAIDRMAASRLTWTRYLPIMLLMPALQRSTIVAEIATQRRDAAQVTIALELYRRVHGEWPATLDQLAPRFLPAVPPDRFDGRPLRYRLIDGRPVLYSIGANRQDNGGRPSITANFDRGLSGELAAQWISPRQLSEAIESPRAGHQIPDGDWIHWTVHPLEDLRRIEE